MSYIKVRDFIRTKERSAVMALLNCNPKILLGNGSDFEYFDEWERILPLAEGHIAVAEYEKELKKIGLSLPSEPYSRGRSIRRWREINSIFFGDMVALEAVEARRFQGVTEELESTSKHCAVYNLGAKLEEKLFSATDDINALSRAFCEEILACEGNGVTVRINVQGDEYIRPTPYLGECIYSKKIHGEALSSVEENTLYFQLLIPLISKLSGSKKITLEFLGSTKCSLEFISYLHKRSLFSGEARVELSSPEAVTNFTTKALDVYPEIWLRPLLSKDRFTHYSTLLGEKYPLSAFHLLT